MKQKPLSEKRKNKPHTEERKKKISKSMMGKKKSLEARKNMSEARKGISLKHEGQFKKGHSAWNKKDKKYSRKTKRVGNKVIGESHFVYMEYNKLKEIPKGFVIHHIDENTFNNDITNLRLMRMEDHHFLHNVLDKERYKFKNKVKKLKEEVVIDIILWARQWAEYVSDKEVLKLWKERKLNCEIYGEDGKFREMREIDKIMGEFKPLKKSCGEHYEENGTWYSCGDKWGNLCPACSLRPTRSGDKK